MGVARQQWHDLPEKVHAAVEARTGPVIAAAPAAGGRNSAIAATVHGAQAMVFVKALPLDHPRAWTQDQEAALAQHTMDAAPRLLWRIQAAGWDLLGFQHLNGRHADYTPGSPDIARVAQTLALLAATPPPSGIGMKTAQRWRDYVDRPDHLARLQGDALLHTDLNPTNVLIDETGRAFLVDWAWPTRAAAWIDPACWVVWLIAAGHTPQEAERRASAVPAWAQAREDALDVFARVQSRLWDEIAEVTDAPWAERVRSAAARWEEHRN